METKTTSKKEVPPCLKRKPQKTEMTSWFPRDNPETLYTGNTNHWAVQRVQGNKNWALQNTQNKDSGVMVPLFLCSGESVRQYPWSQGRQARIGVGSISDLCVEGLDGQLPGELSKGKCKSFQKSWTRTAAYRHAHHNVQYWPKDVHSPFQRKDSKDQKLITSITALPPHNLISLKRTAFKAKKPPKRSLV